MSTNKSLPYKYLFWVIFVAIPSCQQLFSYKEDGRWWMLEDAEDIIISLEMTRAFEGKGKYPMFSNNEFIKYVNEETARSGSHLFRSGKYKYISNGKSFKILVIADHYVDNHNLRSVLIVSDKGIFWKDDYAFKNQEIDEINWENVNYIVTKIIRDKSGGYKKFTKYRLPKKIE